jgi:alkylation response protein AidB-like acyl-CoA dehydrogenase
MDFDLDADQLALRDGAREVLAGLASRAHVRRFTETDRPHDGALWSAIVEQGWLLVDRTEADGGLGFGTVEVALLAECVGAHAAPVPFVSTYLAAASSAKEHPDRADALRSGDRIAVAVANRRLDSVRAERDGARWWLRGVVDPAPYSPTADEVVLAALTADGPGLFLADLASVERRREPAIDITRPIGWLRLDGVPAIRLGDENVVETFVDLGATLAAAEMLGGAQTALDMSVEYARARTQFGKPIGSFQAVKHRCADMLVDVEGMRSVVYAAAWAIGAGDPDASIAASTAKIWCGEASKRVMASALQVHGGIGFTWEHDLHFFLKRAQLDRMSFGDARAHRDRLSARLRSKIAAGVGIVGS